MLHRVWNRVSRFATNTQGAHSFLYSYYLIPIFQAFPIFSYIFKKFL